MALSGTVRGIWEFNGTLNNSADPTKPFGGANPQYISHQRYRLLNDTSASYQGLKFESGQTFSAGSNFLLGDGSTYKLSLGFWWYSPGPVGYTRHAVTKADTPMQAPIIAKSDSDISGGFEGVSLGEFIVTEKSASLTQNTIQLALCGESGIPTRVFSSYPYLPGLHHIFIHYHGDGSQGVARIDIDGQRGIDYTSPAIIEPTVAQLRLNNVIYGYTAHKTTQTNGYISHLVLRQENSIETDDAFNMYTFGYEYLTDTDYSDRNFNFFGVSYRQPTTVRTTQVYGQGGNVYIARSNGEILKGVAPIWDTNFNFEDEVGLVYLTTSPTDDGDWDDVNRDVEWSSEGVKIKGATIRI